jgi:hypothetical protein
MAFFSKAAATVAGFAAGAALANKVGSIVSQTQQSYNKTQFGDVAGAASAAGYKPITKFKNNDFGNSPSALAAQVSKDALNRKDELQVLTYPQDIGKYFIKFSFVSYHKEAALKVATDEPTVVVVFPIPSSLNENFSVTYNDAKLGPVIGTAFAGATKGMEGTIGLGGQVGGAITGAFGAVGNSLTESAYVLARDNLITNETLKANVDKATGLVPNPHLAAIFQDLTLRTHSFTFRFSPKNQQESDLLKKIIKTIKRRMLPGTGLSAEASTGPLFSFPDVVNISFGPKDIEPYKIQKSVLESMTVNYAPNGTPAFFKDGSPTDIEIGLNFKEIRVVTRNDYEDERYDRTVSPSLGNVMPGSGA